MPLQNFPLRDRVCKRDSECCESVNDSNTDMNFGDLALEIACRQTLAQQFDAVHLCLDAASPMIPAGYAGRSRAAHPASGGAVRTDLVNAGVNVMRADNLSPL